MYGVANAAITVTLSPSSLTSLSAKSVTVIGGTAGLGRALARAAAEHGASVRVVGRTNRDGGETKAKIAFTACDLSDMKAAQRLGRELPPTDIVLLTTGTVAAATREVTADGIERDMAVSTLSRLVILRELVPRLPAGARVGIWG